MRQGRTTTLTRLTLLVATGVAPWAMAQEAELTSREIVRRHLEALGGREQMEAIRSFKKSGTYVYNGLEHPIVSYHARGRKCREEISGLQLWGTSVSEDNDVVRGANGTLAWIHDESRPLEWRRLSPPRAALMLEEADLFGAPYDLDAKGHRVELVGPGDVEGTPAHHLKLTLASGLVQSWYLDVESFLVLRKDVEPGKQRDLERPRAWLFDDYRPVNGVLVPFWVFVEEPLFSREYLFETIEANVEIDDALFEPLPGAIQTRPGTAIRR
jgi:hypothetical protein